MPSQNNSGAQYDKQHPITVVATAAVLACRFIGYDGAHATAAGGVHDAQCVSETAAAAGEAFTGITSYSAVVECSEAIAFGDYIKPATDGTGRGAVGTATEHCGRALGATTAAGQLFECQALPHRRT